MRIQKMFRVWNDKNKFRDYDYVGDFWEGYACVRINGKWGFMDEEGKEICEIKYDLVKNF